MIAGIIHDDAIIRIIQIFVAITSDKALHMNVIINVGYKLPCCMGDSDIVDYRLRQEERRNQ